MSKIKEIQAYEILASGGYPTIEAKVTLESGSIGIASVPYGASAGSHEASVLIDGDEKRFNGQGMLKAVANVNNIIAPILVGKEASNQREIDELMINLDGTENKGKLGGNAILSVSLAVARASAGEANMPLYEYIRHTFKLPITEYYLPNPMMVSIEGGKHADNSTDFQEFCISAIGNESVVQNVRIAIESYMALKKILKQKGLSTNVGNEGAFAPSGVASNETPFGYLIEAIQAAGYRPGVDAAISIDPATSELYENGMYILKLENKTLSSSEMIDYFIDLLKKYPIITAEDLLSEDDWDNWTILNQKISEIGTGLIGDDLTVTDPKRLQKAIDKKAINSILIKLNQIGSLTETVDCCMLARQNGMFTVPSHRGGGETNDTAMVDLAVAVNSAFIKVGPTRGERVSKYNRLIEIERELGNRAKVQGANFKEIR
jgi:enolase